VALSSEKEYIHQKNNIYKLFLTKMVFEGRATTQSLYLFKKWLTKKNLFEGRATTQSLYLFKKWLTKKTFLKGGPRHKQKMVFFFEKILFVCVVALPSNTIFVRKTFLFYGTLPLFPEKGQCRAPPFKNTI
jgi:hypothetical protein